VSASSGDSSYDGRGCLSSSSYKARVPYQTLTLTNDRQASIPLVVDLDTATGTFTDAGGKRVNQFDEPFIAAWLGANGFADSADLDQRSADVMTAVLEMTTGSPQARKFSHLSPDPMRSNVASVTAHPAYPAFATVQVKSTAWTNVLPFGVAGALWLIGPIVIFRRRPTGEPRRAPTQHVESPADANQA
jgi:hypothetical protein